MTDPRTKTEIAADYAAEIGRLKEQLAERDAEIERLREWQAEAVRLISSFSVIELGLYSGEQEAFIESDDEPVDVIKALDKLLSEVEGDG